MPNEIKIEDESPYERGVGGGILGSDTSYEGRIENGDQKIESDEDNINPEA